MSSKILIVDDDPDLVESTRLVLEDRGYQVVSAPDAPRAMEKVRSEQPDLILLDIMMPEGTEGFHFVWSLRQDPLHGQIPVVVLSSIHSTTRLRFYPESQQNGTYAPGEYLPVQEFLDKPVEPAKLIETIERALKDKKTSPA